MWDGLGASKMEKGASQVNEPVGSKKLNGVPVRVFLRSLLIQSSLNFWRMQNLGFTYSLIPIVRKLGRNRRQVSNMLTRHLRIFNTHPYMSGAVIGSVLKLEEDFCKDGNCPEADKLKKVLAGPYAAMGDSFFWGSLQPFSAIVGVAMAIKGFLAAPLIFLLIYNPVHMWFRVKGFIDGYSKGKGGVDFVGMMNMPRMSRKVRWMSVIFLGILAYVISAVHSHPCVSNFGIPAKIFMLVIIVLCFFVIQRGISQINILYVAAFLFFVIATAMT